MARMLALRRNVARVGTLLELRQGWEAFRWPQDEPAYDCDFLKKLHPVT